MLELMLMSNSYSAGRPALEHAMDALAVLFGGNRDARQVLPGGSRRTRQVLFVPYAGSDPDGYTEAMRQVLARLGAEVIGAHRTADPVAALARADAVFTGGGNAFRLLRAVQRNGLLTAIGDRVRAGMPYLGVSAGTNLACPTIRTTNDMPIVQPDSLAALGLIPFQINPHYPDAGARDGQQQETRDSRLEEFLEENDVPVLGLREGSWLRVSGARATLGGTAGGRVFLRGRAPRDVRSGHDLTELLSTRPRFDSKAP